MACFVCGQMFYFGNYATFSGTINKMQNINANPPTEIKNAVIILLAVITIVINGLIDHFFAPTGILLTPFVLPIPAALIAFTTKGINPILKSLLVFCCVSLNDIGIKLYGGGTHDMEGQAWVGLFFLAGVVPVYGIVIASAFIHKQNSVFSKIASLIVFPALVVVHFYFFSRLGLGRDY